MLIMFKFVLQYCTDSTVSSVLLIFHKLCGRCWLHQTCGQVQHRCGEIRSGPCIAEIIIAEFVGRVLESQAWSMLWDMASTTRHNETEVQVNSVLPSYDCTLTGMTESTGERCLTFPCLHLNRCDRKYRWKVSYLPMPAPWQVWQEVRWIVSYLPVPAPQQVWQKVQVKGVLPSNACTSIGVTESTGEWCLTFLCLHLNRCDRKYRWKVSYLPMPAPQHVWQKVRWIVSYLPVPAPQQVWQKVQVKGVLPSNGVLPSHACISTGVTESTGERCLTFPCLHLNRCALQRAHGEEGPHFLSLHNVDDGLLLTAIADHHRHTVLQRPCRCLHLPHKPSGL